MTEVSVTSVGDIRNNFMKTVTFQEIINSVTEEQKETIKAKCNWEHMSWLAVFNNYRHMFVNENNKELIEQYLSTRKN